MRLSRVDVALAVVLCAVGVLDVLSVSYTDSRVAALVAVALQTLPVALRRAQPLVMVLLSGAGVGVEVVAGQGAYGDVAGMLAYLVVVFSVARWAGGTARRLAAGLLVLAVVGHELSQVLVDPGMLLVGLVVVGGLSSALWWLGRSLREGAARERDQDLQLAAAVEDERRVIARDLHDVVGHSLAGIALTASAAERQPGADDPHLREALGLISTASRDAASDLRRLVGLLREDAELSVDDPQPGLAALPALVERFRAAGQQVVLVADGTPRPAPRGWELTVYRVVQEGLTNVAKHAPDASAEVRLEWGADVLTVHVRDRHGPGVPVPDPHGTGQTATRRGRVTGGHGLVGLRERVGLYGGTLSLARDEPGFTLTVRLPCP